jgi:hypothetical protein
MTLKYYGTNLFSVAETCILFWRINPYANIDGLPPSYCVWIVPGTVDSNGNPLED